MKNFFLSFLYELFAFKYKRQVNIVFEKKIRTSRGRWVRTAFNVPGTSARG